MRKMQPGRNKVESKVETLHDKACRANNLSQLSCDVPAKGRTSVGTHKNYEISGSPRRSVGGRQNALTTYISSASSYGPWSD